MATASRSPLTSSVEKVNGAKLSRLLIDGGTTALRTIFDSYHPHANLSAGLNANYSTLDNLFRKKVLRAAQWKKLFPPSGAAADSNTFVITLLFLLLTNICGLSPPPLGWHAKPPPSDNSLEANLSRVKFFRNELHGHLPTTAIDTPVFSSLWQDISAVLVALGLDYVAIERLKLEHSGEEDYIEILSEWAKSEEDIKSQLMDIQQSQTQAAQNIAKLRHGLDEMKNTFIKSCETSESVENRRRRDEEDKILKALAMIDTEKDVEYHSGQYQEGTRLSILTKVEDWMDDRSSENRVLVISGKAGMGKSVISAVVSKRMLQANRLSGSHFCQHGKARHRNPKVMFQSLACQLSNIIPEYKIAIVEILSRNLGGDLNSMEVSDLFELLLMEPLSRVEDPGRNILMVIDGVDESEYRGRNELLDVIANDFCKLPAWVRFLVTTRPEINIADNLKLLEPLQLEPSDHENLQDIRHYLNSKLGQPEIQEDVLNYLVEKSEGLMLFSYFLVEFVSKMESILTPELLENVLPSGISSVYVSYFKRLENELVKELKVKEEHFFAFLSAVAASREPLPVAFVAKLFLLDTRTSIGKRKFLRAISCISILLPVEDDRVKFFHKSVKDWLTDTSSYVQHDFTTDMSEGHSILSKLCCEELDHIKHRGVFEQKFCDTETYSLQHGVTHMLEDVKSEDNKALVEMFVLDLELVYAKLCVDHATAAEDIVCSQKQAILSVLPEGIKTQLDNLLFLLRKYHERLKHRPNVFLQTVLNEGEARLSSQASYLLSTKYQTITFMEYMYKDVHEEAPKAAFRCSAEVVCFDVSPQSECMVCECNDEMLYLWSLRTGNLKWRRPSKVQKQYLSGDFTFRTSPSSDVFSCYRSVVFHPSKEVVLPGTLRSAYSYDGDLKPLFPGSNCKFTVCSLLYANGEAAIVTNCPDDAKCIILWSLENGSQVANIRRDEDVLSFACSLDGRMLAVSHSSGSICLIDTINKFRILAENTIPSVCGMIKFSPDHQFLFCWHESNTSPPDVYRLKVKRINQDTFSLGGCASCKVSYKPWEHETASTTGFVLGDPLSCIFESISGHSVLVEGAFVFVLSKETVLRLYPKDRSVAMFRVNEIGSFTNSVYHPHYSIATKMAFSLNGEILYVISKVPDGREIMAWNVPSRNLKARRKIGSTRREFLTPVAEGVIIAKDSGRPELWDFDLSCCIRSWSQVCNITDVILLPRNHVACVGARDKEVIILDSRSTAIKERIPFCRDEYDSTIERLGIEAIACNSKYEVLSTDPRSIQLSNGQGIIWKKEWHDSLLHSYSLPGMFSPKEEFVLLSAKRSDCDDQEVFVLHASSGEQRSILCGGALFFGCKFVSDEECVIDCQDTLLDYGLRLFNIRTGDLLCVLRRVFRTFCLVTCLPSHAIAIDVPAAISTEKDFRIIQVNNLQSEEKTKKKRLRMKQQ